MCYFSVGVVGVVPDTARWVVGRGRAEEGGGVLCYYKKGHEVRVS